ncbi:MAG: DoxX family membrane protein [Bacteroidetes bacterium]|jgi:putative oxidoreductase|nr:DoxX family membrane protein [Bacteroidota bacterium]
MKKLYRNYVQVVSKLSDLALLLLRLTLAYGFYNPAMRKLGNLEGIASWFESMNYPLPTLNAYLATATESLGVILLLLGLGTRIISIPLIIVMFVAIFTVHIGNGFAAGDNGFEIPLYYLIMLFTLIVFGAGKISIDYLIDKKK